MPACCTVAAIVAPDAKTPPRQPPGPGHAGARVPASTWAAYHTTSSVAAARAGHQRLALQLLEKRRHPGPRHAPGTRRLRHAPGLEPLETCTPPRPAHRDAMFHQHMPLVRRIPIMIVKLPQRGAGRPDTGGLIGLTTRSRYEVTQGVQFKDLCQPAHPRRHARQLRGGDWMSRGAAKNQKDIEQAMRRVEQRLGQPLESEIAAGLDMGWTTTRPCWAGAAQLVYLEGHGRGDEERGRLPRPPRPTRDADPMAVLRDQRLRAALVTAIKHCCPNANSTSWACTAARHEPKSPAVLGVTEIRASPGCTAGPSPACTKMRGH